MLFTKIRRKDLILKLHGYKLFNNCYLIVWFYLFYIFFYVINFIHFLIIIRIFDGPDCSLFQVSLTALFGLPVDFFALVFALNK